MMSSALPQMRWIALLLLLMSGVVDAQIASRSGGQQSASAAQDTSPQQTVTIVGCLVEGKPSDAGRERRSESGAANANDYFIRTPAIQLPVGTTVTVGGSSTATSGAKTTTSAGAPDTTTLYRITGLDREQLRPHLNHRVELQGRLSGATAGSNTTAKTTVDAAGRATTRVESRMDVAGVLHATAIKMVSESCQ